MIKEPILYWLQEFCFDLYNNDFLLEMNKEKESNFLYKITPGLIKIDNVSNPGWSFDFVCERTSYNFNIWQDISINLELEDNHDWLYFKKKQALINASLGPLYLSTLLNIFIHYIKEMPFDMSLLLNEYREQLKKQNPLLAWLEEFYLSCCDGDWEYSYGCSIINTAPGWKFIYSLSETILEDKIFDEKTFKIQDKETKCYIEDNNFIIQTHPKGLIDGITSFKEWIEG